MNFESLLGALNAVQSLNLCGVKAGFAKVPQLLLHTYHSMCSSVPCAG